MPSGNGNEQSPAFHPHEGEEEEESFLKGSKQKRLLSFVRFGVLSVAKRVSRGLHQRLARRPSRKILHLEGLRSKVSIYRDWRGVPHIEAQSLHDVYMAQGYVTAQDRLWQMDMSFRMVSGRLAEVLGAGLEQSDRLFRTLSMHKAAERSIAAYSANTLQHLESYCAGVNAYVADAKKNGRLPIEFALLGYEPQEWTPFEVLCIGRLLSYSLSQNMGNELFHHEVGKRVGEELRREIRPAYPEDGPLTIPRGKWQAGVPVGARSEQEVKGALESDALAEELLDLLTTAGDVTKGSNGWVVAGERTVSGKPLLANDPHIDLQTPSTWYQTHLIVEGELEKLNVIGVSLPGVPGILIGHNEQIAWGVTNSRADVQDLFVERRHPSDSAQFQYEQHWEHAEVRREIIRVKGKADVEFAVYTTRHGPVVSDVIVAEEGQAEEVLALQWSALLPSADLEAFFAINCATDWNTFREALREYRSPVLTFLFAGQDGTIACRVGGSIPIRQDGEGEHPVPGWTNQYEWTGFIPFEELPELVNPESGFIVAANQQIVEEQYPYLLTRSWDAPYRAWRIEEMLSEEQPFSLQEMSRMQGDILNLQARRLLPHLLPVLKRAEWTEVEQRSVRFLEDWNFYDDQDAAAPLVYHFFWWQISKRMFEPKMGTSLFRKMVDRINVTDETLLKAASGLENGWVLAAGGFEALVQESFKIAVDQLVQKFGERTSKWRWGAFHRFDPQHPIGRQVSLLGKLIDPRRHFPIGGSNTTVCLMTFQRESGTVLQAAPWRMVVDLNDMSALDLNAPGQSGDPLSRWYDDQSDLFVENSPASQQFNKEQYRAGAHLLVLHPD